MFHKLKGIFKGESEVTEIEEAPEPKSEAIPEVPRQELVERAVWAAKKKRYQGELKFWPSRNARYTVPWLELLARAEFDYEVLYSFTVDEMLERHKLQLACDDPGGAFSTVIVGARVLRERQDDVGRKVLLAIAFAEIDNELVQNLSIIETVSHSLLSKKARERQKARDLLKDHFGIE